MCKNFNDDVGSIGNFIHRDINNFKSNLNNELTDNKSSIIYGPTPEYYAKTMEAHKILEEINQEKIRKEKKREQREIENNEYLRNIDNNVNKISSEFSRVMNDLIIINNLVNCNNNSLQKVADQIDTNNKIQAEIYEELVKSNFEDETERIKTTEKLVNKFSSRVELSANLTQIIQFITQHLQ